MQRVEELLESLTAEEIALKKHKFLTVLDVAAGCGRADVVRLLLSRYGGEALLAASVSHPLHLAVEAKSLEALRLLVDAGGDIEEAAVESDDIDQKNTPLQRAARSDECLDCLKYLLDKGAKTGLTKSTGETALHSAAKMGSADCLAEMLRRGASADERDDIGSTPLHQAVMNRSEECVERLLSFGADPNVVQGSSGATSLGTAAFVNLPGALVALLRAGADVNQVSTVCMEKMMPLHIACTPPRNNEEDMGVPDERLEIVCACADLDPNVKVPDRDRGRSNRWRIGATALHLLVREGRAEALKFFIEDARPDLEAKDKLGRTPLCWAVVHSRPLHLEILLESGAEVPPEVLMSISVFNRDTETSLRILAHHGVNLDHPGKMRTSSKREFSTTPLCRAAILGNRGYVDTLLELGATLDLPDESGRTALHYSILEGHPDTTKLLWDKERSDLPRQGYGSKDSPFHIAARMGDLDSLQYLLQHSNSLPTENSGFYHNSMGLCPLQIASFHLQKHLYQELKDSPLPLSSKGTTAESKSMSEVCEEERFNELLQGVEFYKKAVSVPREEPLASAEEIERALYGDLSGDIFERLAAQSDFLRVSVYLISKIEEASTKEKIITAVQSWIAAYETDPNMSGLKARVFLIVSVMVDSLEAVRLILPKIPELNVDDVRHYGRSGPLTGHLSMGKGSGGILRELVARGADVNLADEKRVTPIFRAVRKGNVEVVRYLIEVGAVADEMEPLEDLRPLHEAALRGHVKVMKALLKKSPEDVNARSSHLRTPLHLAALSGSLPAVKLLLKKGGDLGTKDKLESGPLHYAAMGDGGSDLALFLLLTRLDSPDVEPHAEDLDGNTASHLAAARGNKEVLEVLLELDPKTCFCARNKEQLTPLYLACRSGALKAVKCILQSARSFEVADAVLDCPNGFKCETALHMCAALDLREPASLLLEAGADLRSTDSRGYTPLARAVERDSVSTAWMLLQEMARRGQEDDLNLETPTRAGRMNFLHFPTFGLGGERLLASLVVPERDFEPFFLDRAMNAEPRSRTRLHPVLDGVWERNRAGAEARAEMMAVGVLSQHGQGIHQQQVEQEGSEDEEEEEFGGGDDNEEGEEDEGGDNGEMEEEAEEAVGDPQQG